jgi:dUTP pyrophosphatase
MVKITTNGKIGEKKVTILLETKEGSKELTVESIKEDEKNIIIKTYDDTKREFFFFKRGFEKVSTCPDAQYPRRSTEKSAGYDFYAYEGGIVHVGERKWFRTGIKAYMQENEVLLCLPRSSLGFKHGIRLSNGTGVIDSDYFNNPDNEGEIQVSLQNLGDKPFKIEKGDRLFQAIFVNYLIADNDDPINKKRIGGIGSTGK